MVYVAFDGTQFDNASDCLAYEQLRNEQNAEKFRQSIRAFDCYGEELEIPELFGSLPADNENALREIMESYSDEADECCSFADSVNYITCKGSSNMEQFRGQMKALGIMTGFNMEIPEDDVLNSRGIYRYNADEQRYEVITNSQYEEARTLVYVCDEAEVNNYHC